MKGGVRMLDRGTIDAYLDRISAARPQHADLGALRHLQERHLLSVPFENLDYHFGEEIHMSEEVIDKIVFRRRGGGCYEVNPALGFLLAGLGYDVEFLPGQPCVNGTFEPPLCHVVVRVRLRDSSWLVDVGYGRTSRFPLSLDTQAPQEDPHGEFRVRKAEDGNADVFLNDRPLYRVWHQPVELAAFGPTLWWYRTAPDSPFLQNLFCSLPTDDGRVTIKDNVLTQVRRGERTTEQITDEPALLAAYDEHFGIKLDKVPVNIHDGNKDKQMSFG
jgi:N-hydroxyarylamine O-acetyltransferase